MSRGKQRIVKSSTPRAILLVALVALALVAAGCGSSKSSSSNQASTTSGVGSSVPSGTVEDGTVVYGSLPAVGTPVTGGTVSFSQLTGATPTEILPILSSATVTTADFELNGAMYLQLYSGPNGAVPEINYSQSVASAPPTFSDGDTTITIPLRQGLKWSNGAPVDANDVLFYLDILRAATNESQSNWAQFIPGQIPDNISSMSAPNQHTVVLHLKGHWNPGYFLNDQIQDTGGGIYPLPSTDWNIDRTGGPHLSDWSNPAVAKKIWDYLSKQGTSIGSFGSNPLWRDVDGPFTLKSFSVTNGSYTMAPNPSFGLSPKADFATLSVQTFTSETAALNALKAGTVDVVQLDPGQLGEANALRNAGVSVFGAPSFGWEAGIINFKDTADDFDHVIAQQYARAALQHLVDDSAIIKGIYKGSAAAAYGPVPTAPSSPYAPADAKTPPYPYSPTAAAALLKANGWKVVPNGTSTCAKPGTGAGECGAGIPRGTPFSFTWATTPTAFSQSSVLEPEAISSVARQVAGIDMTISEKAANFISTNYNDSDPAAVKYTNDWGIAITPNGADLVDYYPTQAGYDSPGALDNGDYNDPTGNRLINDSVHSGNLDAVEHEASYLTRDLPDIFLPNPDDLYAVKGLGGPASSWAALSEGSTLFFQDWYRVK